MENKQRLQNSKSYLNYTILLNKVYCLSLPEFLCDPFALISSMSWSSSESSSTLISMKKQLLNIF